MSRMSCQSTLRRYAISRGLGSEQPRQLDDLDIGLGERHPKRILRTGPRMSRGMMSSEPSTPSSSSWLWRCLASRSSSASAAQLLGRELRESVGQLGAQLLLENVDAVGHVQPEGMSDHRGVRIKRLNRSVGGAV